MDSAGSSDGAAPDLLTLIQRVWSLTTESSWPVRVTFDEPPAGHTVVEEYLVVPNPRRPKFLVPLGAPAASRAAFSRYLTTDSLRAQLQGGVAAATFGSPLGKGLFRSRVFVGIESSVPRADWASYLLLRHFGEVLGAPDLVAYLPVRRAIPNAKPTMRLFERSGAPLGYAKVGWSDATRAVVRNEARALVEVHDRLTTLQAPALASAGRWHENEYAIASPLPAGIGSYRAEPSTTPQLLLEIASSGTQSRSSLAQSSFAARVRADLEQAATAEPEASALMLAWLQRLEQREDELDFGRWHGDFVPWNLGMTRRGPVAWDWEYSDPDVPVGLDLVHWHFQHRLSPAHGTLVDSTRTADAEAGRLTTLGIDAEATGLVTSLYLLEVLTRAVRMASQGAGWNPKLYPALLDVAAARDRQM